MVPQVQYQCPECIQTGEVDRQRERAREAGPHPREEAGSSLRERQLGVSDVLLGGCGGVWVDVVDKDGERIGLGRCDLREEEEEHEQRDGLRQWCVGDWQSERATKGPKICSAKMPFARASIDRTVLPMESTQPSTLPVQPAAAAPNCAIAVAGSIKISTLQQSKCASCCWQ